MANIIVVKDGWLLLMIDFVFQFFCGFMSNFNSKNPDSHPGFVQFQISFHISPWSTRIETGPTPRLDWVTTVDNFAAFYSKISQSVELFILNIA